MGIRPAIATAKIVIASAKRLTDVRHFCRSSSRNAEMNVPACPMPTHQTKLVIANAHATGMSTPQMPTPVTNRYTIATTNSTVSAVQNASPA
jgi:hypothetical protein